MSEFNSTATPTTPPTPMGTTATSKADLLAEILKKPMSLKLLDLLNKLSFGNADMKLAVSMSPTALIVTAFTDKAILNINNHTKVAEVRETAILYAKVLKSFAVNCAPGRAQCRHPEVYTTFKHILELYPSDLIVANEVITTLCALCMNDDECTRLCKEGVGLEVIEREGGRGEGSNEQKVAFLKQLFESNESI